MTYSRLETHLQLEAPESKKNLHYSMEKVHELQTLIREIELGGELGAQKNHVRKNKLLPRDRIHYLLDTGSDFLELSPFAGYQLYAEHVPAGGIICGIGKVQGCYCMIMMPPSKAEHTILLPLKNT